MALVFVGGIAILAIVAVGSAATAVQGRRWVSAVFWVVASVFLLAWLYGIAGQALGGATTADHAVLSAYRPMPG